MIAVPQEQANIASLRSEKLLPLLSPLLLVAASVSLFAFLLARFPFDGLSGQDSYAYYYQARELWSGLWGLPPPQWPFLGEGLFHWPVGYHLHIMLGFLFGSQSEVGGRLITLGMAALIPALVASLVGEAWHRDVRVPRIVAGLVAGGVLLFTGVYNRASLSLMADVPAIFWTTLSMLCLLRAWPPSHDAVVSARSRLWWAVACGASFGIAVLLRYISLLLIVPMALYLLIWYRQGRAKEIGETGIGRWVHILLPAIGLAGMACALVPQLIYTISQGVRIIDTTGSVVWSIGNLFQTTLIGPDGTQVFTHTMARFYFADVLTDPSVGFLSPLYLPAFAVGLYVLMRQHDFAVVALLLTWWLVPATFFSGGLYQAHRFVIMFLPPLAAFVGIGIAEALRQVAKVRLPARRPMNLAGGILGVVVVLALAVGMIQCARASYNMASALAASKNQELAVVNAAKQAADNNGSTPKAVDFGISAALYHYTGWPILDIYNDDESEMTTFLKGSGPRLAVIPEASMATQWAGTPSGRRWEWLRSNYRLTLAASSGGYNVYSIEAP